MEQSDDNLDEIVEQIFSKPPGKHRSIQFQLEETTSYFAEKRGVNEFLFDILCIITLKGMEKLFGHKNILTLSKVEFELVCQYIESLGYVLKVYGNDTEETPWDLQERGEYVHRYKIMFDEQVPVG